MLLFLESVSLSLLKNLSPPLPFIFFTSPPPTPLAPFFTPRPLFPQSRYHELMADPEYLASVLKVNKRTDTSEIDEEETEQFLKFLFIKEENESSGGGGVNRS